MKLPHILLQNARVCNAIAEALRDEWQRNESSRNAPNAHYPRYLTTKKALVVALLEAESFGILQNVIKITFP